MTPKTRNRLFIWGAVILGLVTIWIVNEYANYIGYPLTVWRMDLDDALSNIGFFLAGVAAIWTVWLKAKTAEDRAIDLEHKLNGGLKRAAREHMQDSELMTSTVLRMDRIEAERDECREDRDKLKAWVIDYVKGME